MILRDDKNKLIKHGGCEGCAKKCLFNQPVAVKEIAERSKGTKFDCNNTKQGADNGKL